MGKISLRSILAAVIVWAASFAPGAMLLAESNPKIYCILACDTTKKSGIGDSVTRDKRNMRRLFLENVPQSQLELLDIPEEKMTPQGIMAILKELHVERNGDSVVFFYAGHGALDQKRGHFFVLQGDPNMELLRSEVEKEIIGKKPRTAVFITDCCAAYYEYQESARIIDLTPPAKAKEMSPLFRSLFCDCRGTVSITSAKPGEVAMGRPEGGGGLFTFAFVQYVHRNSQQTLSWQKLFDAVGGKVKQDFADSYPRFGRADKDFLEKNKQHTQTVHVFVQTPALGARVKEDKGSLKIVEVVPLSPADQAGFKVGHVVVKINGKEARTEKEYADAVDHSPRTMQATLRGPKGRVREVNAQLNK